MNKIKSELLSGISFDDVLVTKSSQFKSLYPGRILPSFHWMKIIGIESKDDFGISSDQRLVVSEKAFKILSKFNLQNADIEPVL